jgi:hypothetical protein
MAHLRYCPNCQQNVTVGQESGSCIGCVVCPLFLILGLIIPLWPITLPICWAIAFLSLFLNTSPPKRCPICKTPNRMLEPPR